MQGPKAEARLQPLADRPLADIGYYHHARRPDRRGRLLHLPDRLHGRGRLRALLPLAGHGPALGGGARGGGRSRSGSGRGTRSASRWAIALYGQEIDDTITPLEAGLGWILKLDKGAPFPGARGPRGAEAAGREPEAGGLPARRPGHRAAGYPVWFDGRQVDQVRSGGQSPSLGYAIGTTFLPAAAAKIGTRFEVECRGERIAAEVVKRPFWTDRGSEP